MNVIELKLVKRCEICNHLIAADQKVCPYCSGQINATQANKDTEEEKNIPYKWILACVGAIILIVVGCLFMTSKNQNDASKDQALYSDNDSTLVEDDSEGNEEISQEEIETVNNILSQSTSETYTNDLLGYSVPYPSCFKVVSDQPSGCTLSMGHHIKIYIKSSYNEENKSIKEMYRKEKKKQNITYSFQKNNWYVTTGNLSGNMIYWKKVLLKNDSFGNEYVLTFKVKCPEKFKDTVSDFIEYEHKRIK